MTPTTEKRWPEREEKGKKIQMVRPVNRAEEGRGMSQDMTRGNPARLILLFALPLFVGNLFQQLYNMADTLIVGRALGARHWRRWAAPAA